MFEAKLGEAGLLKKIVEAIKDLITDAPIDCTDNAISLQAMDSSHVALVSLKLEANGFETYRCDRNMNIGISLANLAKALKCSSSSDACTLRLTDEPDTITFVFDSADQNKQQEVEVKLMDLDQDNLGIPEQDYSCVVTMPANEFQKVCRDLAMFTDSLQVIATKDGVQFQGKGDSGGSVVRYQQTASADDEGGKGNKGVTVDLRDPVNITFAIKYLNSFTKATSLAESVTLSMSNDIPIVVEYKIGIQEGDGDNKELNEFGFLRFYLAPKIEDEDMQADR